MAEIINVYTPGFSFGESPRNVSFSSIPAGRRILVIPVNAENNENFTITHSGSGSYSTVVDIPVDISADTSETNVRVYQSPETTGAVTSVDLAWDGGGSRAISGFYIVELDGEISGAGTPTTIRSFQPSSMSREVTTGSSADIILALLTTAGEVGAITNTGQAGTWRPSTVAEDQYSAWIEDDLGAAGAKTISCSFGDTATWVRMSAVLLEASASGPSGPTITSGEVVSRTTEGFQVRFSTDTGSGTAYYVVYPTTSTDPDDPDQIVAGNDGDDVAALRSGSQAVSTTGVQTFTAITGLDPGTYRAAVVHFA